MTDKPEPLQYLEAALKSPGRWAMTALVAVIIAVGILLLDHFLPTAFQALSWLPSLAWLVVIAGPVLAIVLAFIHYGTGRQNAEAIPDFEVPTLSRLPADRADPIQSARTRFQIARDAATGRIPPKPVAFASVRVTKPMNRRLYFNGDYQNSAGNSSVDLITVAVGELLIETLNSERKVDFRRKLRLLPGTNNVQVDLEPVDPPETIG